MQKSCNSFGCRRYFRAMKKIIEDANRAGWNHLLSNGYKLKQEFETGFRTYYQATERFLKSAPKVSLCVENLNGSAVQEAFISLKKPTNIDGTIIGYPGIEAIFDGFGIVADWIERFETFQRPTLLIAPPSLYKMFHKLDDLSKGEDLWVVRASHSRSLRFIHENCVEFFIST